MDTIALASSKGGCGKSTLAIHLATMLQISGKDVLLVDMDHHSRTVTEWASERDLELPSVIRADALDIQELLKQASSEAFDVVILDLPPYVSEKITVVTEFSTLTLVPCRPSFADIRTLPRVLDQIRGKKHVVLNACHPTPAKSTKIKELFALLAENDISCCPFAISQRVAFSDALNDGESVFECDEKSKASREVSDVLGWVLENIQKY
jgi:chromosome partitioning protein